MKTRGYIFFCIFALLFFGRLTAQQTGDFRSFQSGDWNLSSTWEEYLGSEWVLASHHPLSDLANVVSIMPGHTVNVSSSILTDQTIVSEGAELIILSGNNLTVANGAGDDLVIGGTLIINGVTNQNSTGLAGAGSVYINGNCQWRSGGITNTDFHVSETGSMTLETSSHKIVRSGAHVYNEGTIAINAESGHWYAVGNSIIDNLAAGTIHSYGNGSIRYEYNYDWYNQYTFNNYGTVQKSGVSTYFVIYRGSFNNYGNMTVDSGGIILEGSGNCSSAGTIEVESDALFKITGSAKLVLNSGAQFTGNGTVQLIQSNTNTVMTVSSGAEVPLSEGILLLLQQGSVDGTGRLVLAGAMRFEGGRIQGAKIQLAPSGIFYVRAGLEKRVGAAGKIENYGHIIHEGAETLNMDNGAIIDNYAGAIYEFIENGTILHRSDLGGLQSTLNNYGVLLKSGGTGNSTLNRMKFYNHPNALCDVQIGSLQLWSYGSGTNYSIVQLAPDTEFKMMENYDWDLAEGSSITGFGRFLIDGGDLSCSGTTNGASIGEDVFLEFADGEIAGNGKLEILGDMLWSGGEIKCGGFIISADSEVEATGVSAGLRTTGNGFISNYGTFTLSAPVATGNISYQNQEGASFTFATGSGFYNSGGGSGTSPFENNGLMLKTGSGLSNVSGLAITSNGIMDVQEGTLVLQGTQFNNQGQVNISAGTLKLQNSGTGSGSGNFSIATEATLWVADSYTLNCGDGTQILGLGELLLSGSGNLNSLGTEDGLQIAETISINQNGGDLGGGGKLYYSGTHSWTGGDIFVGNYYLLEDGSLTLVSSQTSRMGSGSFHNYGTVSLSGSMGGGNLNFYNYENAELKLPGSFSVWHTGGGSGYPLLYNYGLVHKTGNESANCDVWGLNNHGLVWLEEGTLAFYCAGSVDYNQSGSGAEYYLQDKLIFRYGNLNTNNVEIVLDGTTAEIRDHNNNDLLASCTGTSATGSFKLINGANLTTNSNFNNLGTLDLETGILSGAGNFVGGSNSSLVIGSPDGICMIGELGNIRKTGTRSYHQNGNYYYKSDTAQTAGDGLPSVVRSLEVDNPGGLSIDGSVNVTQRLNLISGTVSAEHIELGSSSSAGTLSRFDGYLVSSLTQWLELDDIEPLFPVGTQDSYRPVSLSFDDAHISGGSLRLDCIPGDPGSMGLPLFDEGQSLANIGRDGYWRFTAADGLECQSYEISIEASGYVGVEDYTMLHMVNRVAGDNPWQAAGNHIAATGSNEHPVVSRSGLTVFGEFALASPNGNFAGGGFVENAELVLVSGGVQLSWDPVAWAQYYNVYCCSDPSAAFPDQWLLLAPNLETTVWIDSEADLSMRFYRITAGN